MLQSSRQSPNKCPISTNEFDMSSNIWARASLPTTGSLDAHHLAHAVLQGHDRAVWQHNPANAYNMSNNRILDHYWKNNSFCLRSWVLHKDMPSTTPSTTPLGHSAWYFVATNITTASTALDAQKARRHIYTQLTPAPSRTKTLVPAHTRLRP
jgi:hypothetical protein